MEKSTGKFALYFKKLVMEDITAGDAGVGSSDGGFSSTNINSGDFYAPGDARNLFGTYKKRKPKIQQRRKKKLTKKVYLPGEDAEEPKRMEDGCDIPVKDCNGHKIDNA